MTIIQTNPMIQPYPIASYATPATVANSISTVPTSSSYSPDTTVISRPELKKYHRYQKQQIKHARRMIRFQHKHPQAAHNYIEFRQHHPNFAHFAHNHPKAAHHIYQNIQVEPPSLWDKFWNWLTS